MGRVLRPTKDVLYQLSYIGTTTLRLRRSFEVQVVVKSPTACPSELMHCLSEGGSYIGNVKPYAGYYTRDHYSKHMVQFLS